MKLIPDDISIDFMSKRKAAFTLSGTLIITSLACLIFMGLNLGIDFNGGSAVIAAFKGEVDREKLGSTVQDLVAAELGDTTTQVSVQDFSTGAGTASEDRVRYLIHTEVTSLISNDKRAEISKSVTDRFGEGTKVETPKEGSDVFYVEFKDPTPVKARYAELKAHFEGLGFKETQISSDIQKQLEVQWLEGLDLLEQDKAAAAAQGNADSVTEFAETRDAFLARLDKQLDGKSDRRFTVTVEELKGKVTDVLAGGFADSFIEVESATSVSASVGRDLLANGLLAILYAIIGILIYITLRFDFRFAPGAVVALVHDVIFTLGIFALFQVKFSLPIIAALLTIVGYSLNDTIVVLDRVRETFEAYRGRDLTDLLNRAVNQTLSRTVLTSLTTLIVVVIILIFGGGLIFDFALALVIGVVVGTYSSIFVASPLVYYMDQYLKGREAAAKAAS